MQKWIFTGISGCGRIEFLEEIKDSLLKKNIKVRTHDLGRIIRAVCKDNRIELDDAKILDIDASALRLARALALQKLETDILKDLQTAIHLIGVHLTFKWKGRLIPGFTIKEITSLDPDGFVNVVNNIKDIHSTISTNPKWSKVPVPNLEEVQYWLMEEEFVTRMLAELVNKPVFLVARNHKISNIIDLFYTNKKRVYLSYPITAIKDDDPQLLDKIQGEILNKLEELFVVFNPLAIEDMKLTYLKENGKSDKFPSLINQLNKATIELLKTRTVHRDYQFIDQSDAVVVFYLTDKLSPGVMGEMYYAHRNQKPVFVVFQGKKSPFLTDISQVISNNLEELLQVLREFSSK